MLQMNNVKKNFKANHLLESIDLSVHSGDLIHIQGSNGSGKSTIFKLICHIIEPDAGKIELANEAVLGALIENPNFMEDCTMKTNLKFLASINRNYDEEKVAKLAEQFHLDYYSKEKLKKYSVGMRQKVGIIQAVMEEQNLILLDEPTRGLDADALVVFRQLITELISDGKAVVIASHDNSAEIPFTKSYLLDKGRLQLQAES